MCFSGNVFVVEETKQTMAIKLWVSVEFSELAHAGGSLWGGSIPGWQWMCFPHLPPRAARQQLLAPFLPSLFGECFSPGLGRAGVLCLSFPCFTSCKHNTLSWFALSCSLSLSHSSVLPLFLPFPILLAASFPFFLSQC